MRWQAKNRNPEHGDTVIRRKFLWWPTKLGNEVRWLEFARLRYVAKTEIRRFGHCVTHWHILDFADDDEGLGPCGT